ncbi:MAG: Smr/MutS family protein [Beijerinckiaceae bacterium]
MKHRTLTRDEKKLWVHVQRSVTPFTGRRIEDVPDDPTPPPTPSPAPRITPTAPVKAQKPPPPPPLAPIEPQILKRIRRGTHGFDGVLDLHGLTQAQAHDALLGFLHARHTQGARLVIVITGKGAAGPTFDPDRERGVLRRMVPHWLRLPDLRSLVLGFETAAAHHGGDGAFYVRLRRSRP